MNSAPQLIPVFKECFDQSESVGAVLLSETKIEYINPFALEAFGYKKREEISDLFSHFRASKEYILKTKTKKLEIENRSKEKLFIDLEVGVIEDLHIFTFTNITDKLNAMKEAKDAKKAQKKFIASMSHEIRTPLNSIIGFTDLLLDTKLNTEQRNYVHNAHRSSEKLLGLVNNVLDVSKIEAEQFEIVTNKFNLEEVLKECGVDIYKNLRSDVELIVDVTSGNLSVVSDRDRIKQIFLNLLDNATKYTTEGFVKLYIEKKEELHSGFTKFLFVVEDTGVGVASSRVKDLFQPFRKAQKFQDSGTGLGLYISKHIAKMLGGDIKVETTEGVGSKFFVELLLKVHTREETHLHLESKNIAFISKDLELINDLKDSFNDTKSNLIVSSKDRTIDVIDEIRVEKIVDFAIIDLDEYLMMSSYLSGLLKELYKEVIIIAVTKKYDFKDRRNDFKDVLLKPLSFNKLSLILKDEFKKEKEKKKRIGSLKVLAVDDMELNLMILKDLLIKKYDITPEIARNGEEAVNQVKEKEFDLILMDIMMPILDGLEATKQIRNFNTDVMICAVSANAFSKDIKESKKVGMDEFIPKPVNRDKLKDVLERALYAKEMKDTYHEITKTSNEEASLKHSSLLLSLGKKLSKKKNLDEVLTILNDSARDILEADRSSVFIYDKKANELWTKVAHGIKPIRLPASKGIAGFTAMTKEIQIVIDAYNDFRFNKDVDKVTGYKTDSILTTPLLGDGDEVIGVFQVLNKKSGYFTNLDAEILQLIGEYAALYIENAILHNSL